MHGITDPCDYKPSVAHSSYQMGEFNPHVVCSHSGNYCQSSRSVVRVKNFTQFHKLLWIHLITHLRDKSRHQETTKGGTKKRKLQ